MIFVPFVFIVLGTSFEISAQFLCRVPTNASPNLQSPMPASSNLKVGQPKDTALYPTLSVLRSNSAASRFQIASSLPARPPPDCAAHRLPQAGHGGGGGWGPSTASARPAEVAAPRRGTCSRCIRIRPSPALSPPAAPAPPSRSSSSSRSYPSPPPPPSSPFPPGKLKQP